MRRILIGYDGSERGDDALALGRVIAAAQADAHVVVATVCSPPSPAGLLEFERPTEARRRHVARAMLTRSHERSPELERDALCTIVAKTPAEGLHRCARERAVDVIVVGASHRSALGRIWPGSVTERTLHGSPCAIAVAPPRYADRPADAPLSRVGVGLDGSREAQRATDVATRLAAAVRATLVLVSVVDVSVVLPLEFNYADYVRCLHDAARARLAAAAASAPPSLAVEQRQIEGRAADELVDFSGDLDLLLIGSRGYGPVRRLALGSVSAEVVRRAACPVLVLPRSGDVPRADALCGG